jgi:uncharacterized membrane protein YhaH (DUF805 family)
MSNINLENLLFGFEGRINRGKYWLAILLYVIASVIVALVGVALGADSVAAALLNAVVGIGTFISGIAVGIKRLHDRNRSGWLLLLFYILPGVLVGVGLAFGIYGMASDSAGNMATAGVLCLAAAGIGIWAFIELGCLRGTIGQNPYGLDPLEAAPAH